MCKRIGVAFTRPKGPTQRREEYSIHVTTEAYGVEIEDPTPQARYSGYREQQEGGEAMVGLPSAGPDAWWAQPMIKFFPGDFEEVRIFDKRWSHLARR